LLDHNYNVKEGRTYGYTAAVSEDDRKAGVGASDILMFRYLGQRNGVYTLAAADTPSMHITCQNPCQYVKVMINGSVVKRSEFSEGTIIASAFEDAFNGKL
jgi:hypothetical protein